MNKIFAIIKKDIITELRTKELFSSMLLFALLIIVIFNFSFGFSVEILNLAAPAMLWISFIFAGILGLSRSFALEKEGNAILGVLLTPTDRSLIYAGKMISNTIFVFIVGLVTVLMFILFFNYNFSSTLLPLVPIVLLGTIGFVSVGTLFSAIAINTRLREVLLPILLFPIIIPVVVACVSLSGEVLEGGSIANAASSLKLLIAFDIIFVTACAVTFEYVISES
ncbi:MAG: heme exporter protein CcmB [Thermodesulfobacteriota bacterium]